MIKRHLRKSQDRPQGTIAEREGPIHISNVKVLERGERRAREKVRRKRPPKRSLKKRKRKRLRRWKNEFYQEYKDRVDPGAAKTAWVQERE